MARVIGATRRQEKSGTQMKFSEMVIFAAIAIALIMAARWYFVVYRNSPGVALSAYLGAIKSGDVEQQYAMIDDSDKQFYPSQKDYEKAPVAHGYTERITGMEIAEPVPNAKNSDVTTLKATLKIRTLTSSSGKSTPADLTQTGETQTAADDYTLRKDKDGKWKVWLSKSPMTNLLKITPNPAGDSF